MKATKHSNVTIELTKAELTEIIKAWAQSKGFAPDQVEFNYSTDYEYGQVELSGATLNVNRTVEKITL